MGHCRVNLVSAVVRSFVVPVLVGTSAIYRFVKGIFPPARKIVSYNSKPVPILSIKDMPGEVKDREKSNSQDATVVEEDSSCMVREARQKKDLVMRRRAGVFSRDRRKRASTDRSVLEWDSTKAWIAASGIIEAFPNMSFNFIVLNSTSTLLSSAKNQQNATADTLPLAIIQNIFDEPSPYISNTPICEIFTRVHHQFHVGRIQKNVNHERVTQEHETRLTEY